MAESTEAKKPIDVLMANIAITVISGFFIMALMLFFVKIPEANVNASMMFFGALIAGFSGILGYFFGSSKGSADKTAALTAQAEASAAETK